jgi:YVTN family beta-propeller protein
MRAEDIQEKMMHRHTCALVVGLFLSCLALRGARAAGRELAYLTAAGGLQVIDTATNQLVSTNSASIIDVAVSPDGTRLYALSSDEDGTVEIIDAVTKQITASVGTQYYYPGAGRLRLSPDGTKAYVASGTSQILSVDTVAQSATVISLGHNVQDLAISPDGKRAYLVQPYEERESTEILVMDTLTNNVVATINVQFFPDTSDSFIAGVFSPDGRFLYLPEDYDGSILVIDTSTNVIAGTIRDDLVPKDIAISPDGHFAYISHSGIGTNAISVIDLAARSVAASIALPHASRRLALTTDGSRLFAVNPDACSVTVVDTASCAVLTTIAVNESPNAIAIGLAPPPLPTPTALATPTPSAAPGAARVCAYVTHSSGEVSVIDTHTQLLVGGFAVPMPVRIALKPDGTRAYVTSNFNLAVIDTSVNAVTGQVVLGSAPGPVMLGADGATAYVGLSSPCYILYAVDTADGTIRQRIGCTDCSTFSRAAPVVGVAISPDGQRAYVAKVTSFLDYLGRFINSFGEVLVVDLTSGATTATIAFDEQPSGIVITPDGRTVYVALTDQTISSQKAAVGVIDTTTNTVANIIRVGTGAYAWAVAVQPDGQAVYVAYSENNQADNSISVIGTPANLFHSNEVIGSVQLEYGPVIALAFTPDSAFAYAVESNYAAGSNKVSIINTAGPSVVYRMDIPDSAQDIAIGTVPYGCVVPLNPVPTATRTSTPSATATPTQTKTPSVTRTSTPQPPTATDTPTATATSALTSTPTPTQTPTSTPHPPTATRTPPPTAAATLTSTATPPSTPTCASTSTQVPTFTSTVTPLTGSGGGCSIASSDRATNPTGWGLLLVPAMLLRRGHKPRLAQSRRTGPRG